MTFECSKCKVLKETSQFSIKKKITKIGIKQYFSKICKPCKAELAKQFRLNNPDKIKEYNISNTRKQSQKKYHLKNNRKEYFKRRYLKRKLILTPEQKSKKREYKRKRRLNSIFRLRENISNSIYKVLKGKKAGKSILKYLGYTIQELRENIEKQFDKNMNWENYGKYWHLDHIIPHSLFQYNSMEDREFKECWSLSNLRPLEAKQNLSEGASKIRHKLNIKDLNNE